MGEIPSADFAYHKSALPSNHGERRPLVHPSNNLLTDIASTLPTFPLTTTDLAARNPAVAAISKK